MSTMTQGRWIRGLALLGGLLLGTPALATLPQYDGKVHEGVASCASSVCHGATVERGGSNVLQNEYVTWTRYDKHADAYKILLTPESQRIAKNLGLPNAQEAAVCLDCHADNVPVAQRGAEFDITDGVGCEACHGGSEDWIARHTAPEATHASNLAAGLYPTDELTARTDLCLSCHLGTEDKFATHQIMGAGHPRLAFELSTFTELEPPHWARDADYATRKQLETPVATWTAGLLASARHTLSLLEGRLVHEAGLFPEIALFDCHACHHPMSDKRWAPTRLTQGLDPGAIRLNDAQFALLLPVAEATDRAAADALLQGLRALNGSVATGFDDFKAATAQLRAAVDRLAATLARPLSAEAQERTLAGLVQAAAQGDYRDYVLAEQAAMALDVLLLSTARWDVSRPAMDRVFETVDDEDHFDPEAFAQAVAGLAAGLQVTAR
jgi:uncharacterized membrane protein